MLFRVREKLYIVAELKLTLIVFLTYKLQYNKLFVAVTYCFSEGKFSIVLRRLYVFFF